ncbi:tumor necrosis factor ligand superfamily member 10-like [Glandiceps talaboti]
MEKQNKFPSVIVISILILHTLLILVIYPIIIGFTIISFQNELSQIEFTIQHLETRNALDPTEPPLHNNAQSGERPGCTCERSGGEDQSLFDYQRALRLQNSNRVASGDGILRCCSADEDSLRTIIKDEVQQLFSSTRQDKSELTLGQVKRYIQRLLFRNSTELLESSRRTVATNNPGFSVAIHLTGGPAGFTANKGIHGERGKVKVGTWESVYGQAFKHHIDVDRHGMIVPLSGIYYIYSQAYFRDERDENQRSRMNINEYLHYTVLDSSSYAADPINLMKSGRTQEGQANSDYYYSSYHAGLFRLREGDKIYMKVYLPSRNVELDCHQESTFMGMYLVSED